MSDKLLPALIVGAGPVGLTLAAHLHHHGVPCRIIERAAIPSDKSKALVLWGRSLEMLDDLGIVASFLRAGRFLNASQLYGNGRPLARIPFTPQGTEYPRPLMLAQCETERLLTEHLQNVGITVERAMELTDFRAEGDGVTATLRHAEGREEMLRCTWLLGCDGAHSTVRHKLGLEFHGEAEPNDWILADCHIEGPIPSDELSLFWHHKGVLAFFPFADRFRVLADMGPARTTGHPPEPTLAEVQTLVNERGPEGVRLSQPHWLSGFRIHERKVNCYRSGRCFLLGDAAHIHSPAGGQGMNTGMQDAWNLAWKLALVHKGRARPSLLDSYDAERSAIGEMVLRNAGRMTRIATLRRPVAQFVRNRLVRLLGLLPSFRRSFVRDLSEMTVHYPHSPLNGEGSGARWLSGGIRPGDRVPDARLREARTGQEQRLLALLRGPQHHLLLLPANDDLLGLAAFEHFRAEAVSFCGDLLNVHLLLPRGLESQGLEDFASLFLDTAGNVRRTLRTRGAALALVRPDGYLAFRASLNFHPDANVRKDGMDEFFEYWNRHYLADARESAAASPC